MKNILIAFLFLIATQIQATDCVADGKIKICHDKMTTCRAKNRGTVKCTGEVTEGCFASGIGSEAICTGPMPQAICAAQKGGKVTCSQSNSGCTASDKGSNVICKGTVPLCWALNGAKIQCKKAIPSEETTAPGCYVD